MTGCTPQTLVGDKRNGGYTDLRTYFGKQVLGKDDLTYRTVIAIFAVALLMALAISWAALGTIDAIQTAEWFIASAMVLLRLQKLRDVESFSTLFLNCDCWRAIGCPMVISTSLQRRSPGS